MVPVIIFFQLGVCNARLSVSLYYLPIMTVDRAVNRVGDTYGVGGDDGSDGGVQNRKRQRSMSGTNAGKKVKESLPNLSEEEASSISVSEKSTIFRLFYPENKRTRLTCRQDLDVRNINPRQSEIRNEIHTHSLSHVLPELYAPSVEAKLWAVASKHLDGPSPPTLYPEYTRPGGTEYVYRELGFWTSGFFPGSLYLLLERRRKYAHRLGEVTESTVSVNELQFE